MSLTLLAFDTSTEACSVALLYNNEITTLEEIVNHAHSQRILPMIDQILSQSDISLNQLDSLVFGQGPGSFTGVRMAASIAQGLAFGQNLPVIPISSLQAIAQASYELEQNKKILATLDARMDEVYFSALHAELITLPQGEFVTWKEILPEQVIAPQNLLAELESPKHASIFCQDWCLVGKGWDAYSDIFQHELNYQISNVSLPSARFMLRLALPAWYQKNTISALEIEPAYLRNEVVAKPK